MVFTYLNLKLFDICLYLGLVHQLRLINIISFVPSSPPDVQTIKDLRVMLASIRVATSNRTEVYRVEYEIIYDFLHRGKYVFYVTPSMTAEQVIDIWYHMASHRWYYTEYIRHRSNSKYYPEEVVLYMSNDKRVSIMDLYIQHLGPFVRPEMYGVSLQWDMSWLLYYNGLLMDGNYSHYTFIPADSGLVLSLMMSGEEMYKGTTIPFSPTMLD